MDTSQDFISQIGTMFLVLCGLLAVTILILYGLRSWMRHRLIRPREEARIQLIEQFGLTHKTRLFLLEVEGRRLLVAESSEEVRALGEVTRFTLSSTPAVPLSSRKEPGTD